MAQRRFQTAVHNSFRNCEHSKQGNSSGVSFLYSTGSLDDYRTQRYGELNTLYSSTYGVLTSC